MDFNPDDPDTWPADAESWYQVSYTAVTIANRRVPFPPVNYYAIYGSIFNRDPHLSLYTVDTEHVSNLLASLPQWEFTGETEDNPRTWRVIWLYHPVISIFSTGSKIHTHSANFAVIEELSEHVQEEIPEILDSNRDCVIFHQTLPLAIFHSNQTVSLPITLIDSFRSVLLHPFSRPSATTKQEFLRYLTTLLVVLPLPLNLHSSLLRAKLHSIATTTSKKTAANGLHILLTLNVGPRLSIANVTSLLCRSPLPLRPKAPPPIPAAKSRLPAASMATPPIPPPQSEEVTAPTVATPTVLPETVALSHLPSTSSAPPPPPRRTNTEMSLRLPRGCYICSHYGGGCGSSSRVCRGYAPIRELQDSGTAFYCAPSSFTIHRNSYRTTKSY